MATRGTSGRGRAWQGVARQASPVTITSSVPSVIAALVSLFTSAATLGQATPPVTVYDGPQTTEDAPPLILWVGLDDPDNPDAAPLAASSQQEWAGIGKRGRNETVVVECVAYAWSGLDDIAGARTAAYGIMAAVETVMQATDSSGLGGNILFPDPGVTGGTLRQNNTTKGAVAQVGFQIILKARIGG